MPAARPDTSGSTRIHPGAWAAVIALAAMLPAVAPAMAQQPSAMPGLVITTTQTPPQPPSSASPPQFPGAPTALPGLVVSSPPAAAPQALPPGQLASPQPPPAVKAKPKPKQAPVKEARINSEGLNGSAAPQGIVALVNDEPVTAYEVNQLATFMSLSANFTDRAKLNMKAIAENPRTNERLKAILDETIKANQGKSREQVIAAFEERKKQFVIGLQKQAVENAKASLVPGFRKQALEELIEERLKYQEAKRLTVSAPDEDVDKAFKNIADRNKMTPEQFVLYIKGQGSDANVMKARFKAQFTWREVVRRRFGHMINVNTKDIEQFVANSKQGGQNSVELRLHKVTLSAPGRLDQKIMAQRLDEAETMRGKFTGCKETASLTKGVTNARFEDLSYKSPASIEEPVRSFLLAARDGEMLPGNFTAAGVELYAVCGRRTVKIDEQKRQQVENELQSKEFERLASRHLADLKKDALIERK